MVSKALGAACGDRGLIQLVHLDVEGRVLKLLQNPNSTDVQDLQTVTRMLPDIEDRLTQGTRGEDEEVGLDLGELDKACENVALMIQYIESYEGFVRHCCEEIERARSYREKETGEKEDKESEVLVLPKITQLGEIAMELSAVLGGGEVRQGCRGELTVYGSNH